MRDVAVVSYAQSPCLAANRRDDMADILLPVIREAVDVVGIERDEINFYASGSHDFFEGRTFAYIESLDAVGAWPPISESHVEMDAAWAFAEAWFWLQLGQGDIALVYGIGRGSLPQDLDQVMPAQLDPYFLAPLRPHRDALAGLQACAAIDAGLTSEQHMAEIVARCLAAATGNPRAQKSGHVSVEDLMAAPYVSSPLREHDVSPPGDAAAVVVLAAGDTARRLADRPAWVRAVDHRIDTHYPGMRDLATWRRPPGESLGRCAVRQSHRGDRPAALRRGRAAGPGTGRSAPGRRRAPGHRTRHGRRIAVPRPVGRRQRQAGSAPMSGRAFVVGVGMTPFTKAPWSYRQLVAESVGQALADAGIGYDDVQRAAVGYVFEPSVAGQRALYDVGMTGIPVINVNNNCGTGLAQCAELSWQLRGKARA